MPGRERRRWRGIGPQTWKLRGIECVRAQQGVPPAEQIFLDYVDVTSMEIGNTGIPHGYLQRH